MKIFSGLSISSYPTSVNAAIACLILIVLVVSTYWDSQGNSFQFDDEDNITQHGAVQMNEFSFAHIYRAAENGHLSTRPIPNMSFAIDWWRGAGNPRAFIQTNIVIHTLATLSCMWLIYLVITYSNRFSRKQCILIAFCAAAFWAIHPIQSQAVTYVVQRMASFSALFVVLALATYIKGRNSSSTRKRIFWFIGSGSAFLLAIGSKENAWIFLPLVVLTEYAILRSEPFLKKPQADKTALLILATAVTLIALDLLSGSGPISDFIEPGYATRDFSLTERLLTQPRIIAFHFSQIFWPLPSRFSIEHEFVLSTSLTVPLFTLFALSAVFIWIAIGVKLITSEHTRSYGFWVLWVPFCLSIESSLIPLELVFEHRMYLPSIGITALLIMGAADILGSRPALKVFAYPLITAIIIAIAASTVIRLKDWKTQLTLYESAIAHAPNSSRVWANLAMYRFREGLIPQAQSAFRKALAIDPNNAGALENYGVMMLDLQQLEAANNLFLSAYHQYQKKNQNKPASLLNHMGELSLRNGNPQQALMLFTRAIRAETWNSIFHWNIALTYERLGLCTEAHRSWLQYIRLEPDTDEVIKVRQHIREKYSDDLKRCQ